ncbi:MAG: asparagine synthase-related protein [Candidatus Saccharibacteria bacterium]
MEQHINNRTEISQQSSELSTAIIEKYSELFDRIASSDILPMNENSEWLLESLESTINYAFLRYGHASLLVNDGKIYTTLSGGLDSTLAIAFLRNNFPTDEIITFTMGGSVDHPDVIHARLAAEKFNTTHHEYIPDDKDINDTLVEYKELYPSKSLEDMSKSGDTDVYLHNKYISRFQPKVLLANDGIDELIGGYWDHRRDCDLSERRTIYTDFWNQLIPKHLEPLIATSDKFGIDLLFPYLDPLVIADISRIPLLNRSTTRESKIPLRTIARRLGVPEEIITRPKRGQVGMLDRK